jgi:hypothetical protein
VSTRIHYNRKFSARNRKLLTLHESVHVNDSVAALDTGLDRHGLARKALKVEAAADAGHETELDA